MTMTFILAMLRHILTFGGGALVAKGYSDQATADAIIGAVLTLVGGVWSIVEKQKRLPA